MTRHALIAACLFAVPSGALSAQEAGNEAVAVVQQLFDAMRAGDTASMRPLFADGARLVTTSNDQEGIPQLHMIGIDQFVQGIAAGSANGVIDEQIWDVEVRVDDNLATVWNQYALYYQEKLHHCGVDAFQLAKTSEGWKILAIADTQRLQGCEDSPSR